MRSAVVVMLCVLAAPVAAQETALDPTKAQFTASLDHATVTRYELRHYVVGQTTPVRVDNLGKPVPDGTNTITATFAPFPKDPTKQYTATVAAIGPNGTGVSTPSNTYLFADGVQLTMAQKVRLTLTPYDAAGNVLPPPTPLSLWSVEGASETNNLGTFEPIEPLAVWYLPAKVGVFKAQASIVVNGLPFMAFTTVVVNPQ